MAFDQRRKLRFNPLLSRRELLWRGAVIGAGVVSTGTTAWAQPRRSQAGRVLIGTTGGASEAGQRKAWWDPFTAETGIEVVTVITTMPKIIAGYQAGNVEIDVPNVIEYSSILLEGAGALERLDRSKFKLTNLRDIVVKEYHIAKLYYSTVMGHNIQAFPKRHPTSWAEFWDTKAFPGPRMLQDASAEYPNLEQALLADGVPPDKLYPLDLDRAFAKLGEIRKSIVKWWNSGAVAMQLFSERQVVLGSIWDGRIGLLIDAGAPVAIEWNQAQRHVQALQIAKGAPNRENAYKLIDYGMQPKVQAEIAKAIVTSPGNPKAFDYLDEQFASRLPTSPEHRKIGFDTDVVWWVDNLAKVIERWNKFLLSG